MQRLCIAIVEIYCIVGGTWMSAMGAVVIYDTVGLPGKGGMESDIASYYGTQLADNFRLSESANTISGIQFFGLYSGADTPTTPDDFTIRFYRDTNPAVPIGDPLFEVHCGAVARMDTGLDAIGIGAGHALYQYWTRISPLTFTAGQIYWLSIVNNTAADSDDNWHWMQTELNYFDDLLYGSAYRNQRGVPWTDIWPDLAFSLTADGELGDYNRNNVVDAADQVVWRNTFGRTGLSLLADANVSHEVDAADYVVWRDHLGQMPGDGSSASSTISSVPEPLAGSLAFLGIVWLLAKRRPLAISFDHAM